MQPGEGTGNSHILGNAFPSFRFTWNNTLTYKRLTFYGLLDGTIGNHINNQGEGWGLLDFASNYFDQGGKSVETAKPVGYGWRVGGSEGAGDGGFYDLLGPNNYNTEDGSYAKIREMSVTYRLGRVRGIGGDWTLGRRRSKRVHVHELLRLRPRSRRRRRQRGLRPDQPGRCVRLSDAPHVHGFSVHAVLGA